MFTSRAIPVLVERLILPAIYAAVSELTGRLGADPDRKRGSFSLSGDQKSRLRISIPRRQISRA
jgi:hypothetical protein